jgi:hypothetical protein
MTKPRNARGRGWTPARSGFRLDERSRRSVLEALDAGVDADGLIEDVEIHLGIALDWRATHASIAGRRRLLVRLAVAATAFERALGDLDWNSWDELASTVDRTKVELPPSFFRFLTQLIAQQPPTKQDRLLRILGDATVRLPPLVPVALSEISRAAQHQLEELRSLETRGKPKEDARDNAIRRLAETFHNATHESRDYRGRLIDFVKTALKGAKLPVPQSEEKVWALVPKGYVTPRSSPRR